MGREIMAWGFMLGAGVLGGCGVLAEVPVESITVTYEQRLAQHLQDTGAIMYGAYWCPHCHRQLEMFKGGVDQVPYLECDPRGENAEPQRCRDRGLQGYPTWEIEGQLYPGVRSLEELARHSGFMVP